MHHLILCSLLAISALHAAESQTPGAGGFSEKNKGDWKCPRVVMKSKSLGIE